MGYTGWVGRLSEKNAVLTDILLAQGGTPAALLSS